MDRDRYIEREAAGTAPRRDDDSLFVAPDVGDRVVVEGNRDVAGDAQAPADQDILVREDAADTMPSRALNDPRELTPDQMQRLSTDTTSAPNDMDAPNGPMDAQQVTTVSSGGLAGQVNMAGRPLQTPTTAQSGFGRWGSEIFAEIREGMRVIDLAGEDVGKVDYVSAGDPEAVTTEGQEPLTPTGGIIGDFGRALSGDGGEPDVPEPFRSRLIREGYIKVDGKGWFGSDHYLTPDMIDRVTGDEVRLAVTRDNILNDQG